MNKGWTASGSETQHLSQSSKLKVILGKGFGKEKKIWKKKVEQNRLRSSEVHKNLEPLSSPSLLFYYFMGRLHIPSTQNIFQF